MPYVPAQLNPLASFGSFLMAAAKTSTFLSIVIKNPLLVSLLLVAPVGTQTAYCDVVWAIKSVISEEKREVQERQHLLTMHPKEAVRVLYAA